LNFKNFNQVILKSKKIANVFKKKIIWDVL
jgi:hypothetical protein